MFGIVAVYLFTREKSMRKLIGLIAFLFFTTVVFAQKGQIIGKVVDQNGKALPLVTVTVFNALDTTIITYRMTNEDGNFKITNLPIDKDLRLLATYSGYEALRENFSLTDAKLEWNFDTLRLVTTTKDLDEVVVISERPPVLIKKDTIEFNANAFKTLPNALVEDLLKKLPGVRVDANGNITVNGKPVNKILVDGKSFFGNDPKMATRNLPANAIDKVQVVDDKEQALLNGDNNTSNIGKVVNITLKKGMKKGMFGKLYGGGGTKDRYEAGGIANIFRDTLQVSVLGYSNNMNRPGFSYGELMNAGGLQRSNSNRNNNSTSTWGGMNGSSIMINGVNFGGSPSFGLATSNGAGFNINHAPSKNQSFYVQYYFGAVRNVNNPLETTKIYNGDTTIENNKIGTTITKNFGHNLGAGMKLTPDSLTTINLNASYTVGLERTRIGNEITSDNNILGALSQGNVGQYNEVDNYNYTHSFYYIRKGRKNKSQNFIISNAFSTGIKDNSNETNALLHYFYPNKYDSVQNQLRTIRLPQTSTTLSVIYRTPISKLFSLRFTNRYRYDYVSNKTTTNQALAAGEPYDILNTQLSNSFKRGKHDFTFYQGFQFEKSGWSINPYIGELILNSNVDVASIPNKIQQNLRKLVPSLHINYKDFSINYNRDYVLPDYSYLLPILDNSDPYNVSYGNPYLKLGKQDEISLNANFNDQKNNLNVWFWASVSQTDNDVVLARTIDAQGIQTFTPVNANGTKAFRTNYNIDKDIKITEKTKITFSIGGYHEFTKNRMFYNGDSSWQTTASFNNWSGIHINFNDVIEWDNTYNPYFNFTKYSNANFSKINISSQNITSGVVVRYPKHIIWETNMNYTYNSSLNSGNKNLWRWTAAINFTFLKDEKGVLKLSVYDILNQNSRYVNIYASQNTWSRTSGTMLPRYLMATFTYNIRSVGQKKKKVGGESLFSF